MEYSEGCIISRLDSITRSSPDSTAIVHGANTITYSQLKRLSADYAHWLAESGIQKLDRVLVDLPRSDRQIIIQIALLRLGAIYVPRNTDIVDVARVVADCDIKAYLHDDQDKYNLDIDMLRVPQKLSKLAPNDDYGPGHSSNHPICILTTSGTTGNPKYLLLPSRSHVNLLVDNWYCRFDRNTRILYHSPASFDAATIEVWSALLNGGTLVISELSVFDIDALFQEVIQNQVNTLWLTSAVFSNVVNFRLEYLCQLRAIMTGGDTVSASDVRQFKSAFPDIDLVNCWGPAENGTFSTCARFTADTEIEDPLQIGRAIEGIQVYLISDEGDIIEESGKIGRLYVSGAGMFLGYICDHSLDLPLTKHKYVTELLFDTGDYAEYSKNGNIQFLGRRDDLIKIGGKRVYLNSLSERLVADIKLDFCYAHPVGDASDRMIDLFVVANSKELTTNQWRTYHEEAYQSGLIHQGLYSGWIDPHSGDAIPLEQMDQWADDYSTRIAMLGGTRYLDIGCGSGIFLSRQPSIEQYTGIDISPTAIEYLCEQYAAQVSNGHVIFTTSDAVTYLEHCEPLNCDVVLLNSVVTYFDSKYEVQNLLSALYNKVDSSYLYLGDVVSDALYYGAGPSTRSESNAQTMLSLQELTFSFTEIYSLLSSTLGDVHILFMPKLCGDLNNVFRQRYDVLVRRKREVSSRQTESSRYFTWSSTTELTDVDGASIIQIGGYDDYLLALPQIRAMSTNLKSRNLKLCPFYSSPRDGVIALAIATDPYELIYSLYEIDLPQSPICLDAPVSRLIDREIRSLVGGTYPIRYVHLLYYLPTTGRGKLDRGFIKFLGEDSQYTGDSITFQVCRVLNISTDEVSTNVFELGLTSLHAMRVALQLEHTFKVPMTPKTLFELSTAEKLADYINSSRSAAIEYA